MSKRIPIVNCGRFWTWTLLLAGALGIATGCDDSDQPPVTAATSKFEVDRGDNKAAPRTTGTLRTEDATDESDLSKVPPKPPSQPPRSSAQPDVSGGTQSGSPSGAKGSSSKSAGTKKTPAANGETESPPVTLDATKVPDGSAAELLAYLDQVMSSKPRTRNQQELVAEFRKLCDVRIRVAEKILEGKATDDERLTAARHKVSALLDATQLGMTVEKELVLWCAAMAKDKSPQVAKYGRLMQFQLNLGNITRENAESAVSTLAELKVLLAENADEETFQAAQTTVMVLQQNGFKNEMREACALIGERFKESKSEKLAAAATQFMELANTLELDFGGKIDAVLEGTPDSEQPLIETAQKLLARKPTASLLEMMTHATRTLERAQRGAAAELVLALVEKAFAESELADKAVQMVANGRKRQALVGSPILVEGVLADNSPFDWKSYMGKIVILQFWATDSEESFQDFAGAKESWDKYRDEGVEVVTINLDRSRRELDRFLSIQKLPWPVVVSTDPKAAGLANPVATQLGVDLIPFNVLVGRDGNVAAVQIHGEALELKLASLLAAKDGDGGKPEAAPIKKFPEAGGKKSSHYSPLPTRVSGFVAFDEPAAPAKTATRPAGEAAASSQPAAAAPEKTDDNPYSPRADLSPAELADFILNMREKPKSIQGRPGFADAVVEAADRLLAAQTPEKLQLIAVTAKFEVLHKQACAGDDGADKKLAAFVTALKDDVRPKIAAAVRFFQLERKVIEGDALPAEKISDLLAEIKDFAVKEKLDARHLRLASSTVRVINRLEDADEREKLFVEFGNLFAKATDKELARYGKKLAKPPDTKESELVGQPLELKGATFGGAEFDWSSYRGKVVLVDFWATWCGPCIREMPHVKALHEKFKARGFDIVGVSLDKDQDALTEFLARNEVPWTTLAGDETQELATKYGVRGIPTMMLVDRDGKVVAVSHSSGQLVPEIEKLLAAK